jgi:BioD-like phosphotransacetylase family protein
VKSLYVTSVERYSGKTATCLALGRRFLADGFHIGYLKPLSLQPKLVAGRMVDEDADFIKEALGLFIRPADLSPVVVTADFLHEYLRAPDQSDLINKVKAAYQTASTGVDILLLEGGASLREGHAFGLPTPEVARALSSHVLVVVKYRGEIRVLDDALSSKARLGDLMNGVIINRVPAEAESYVKDLAIPHLEQRGIPVLGILPEDRSLAALTVAELIKILDGRVLTEKTNHNALVETLTVGAMTAETALHRFREQTNKAVITGGDRTDIQLAALETSTAVLVLTGNLMPSPLVVRQAEVAGVPILLVKENTIETVGRIEAAYGKTRLAEPEKLETFLELMERHVDLPSIFAALELQ